jgi:hypothetical protein
MELWRSVALSLSTRSSFAKYKAFYDETRGHFSLKGKTPKQAGEKTTRAVIPIDNYSWASKRNGLFNTPIAC